MYCLCVYLKIIPRKQDYYSMLSGEASNLTITFEIKKISMEGMTKGEENFQLDFESLNDVTHINRSFSKAVPHSYKEYYTFRYGSH